MTLRALQVLLPPELQFLISNRGTRFKANAFKILVHSEEFIHLLIAHSRPQSIGIAERFVHTLKEWPEDIFWRDYQELTVLLQRFLDEYSNRSHLGLSCSRLVTQ